MSQMRRNITAFALAQTARRLRCASITAILVNCTSSYLIRWCHRILERTSSCEVLSVTDPTLHLLVFELFLHTTLVTALILLLGRLPINARSKNDILAHTSSLQVWTRC